jgi:putative nucleotidyltransferase with HDIG domain
MAILEAIHNLAVEVDARVPGTQDHSVRVSEYATAIASALGYSSEGISRIRTAALLHDVGKVGLGCSDEQLTDSDWQQIKTHPGLGVTILRHVGGLRECLPAIQCHHERNDGSGYPNGLCGESIPLDARILAVADTYDALTTERPYRPARSRDESRQIIRQLAGGELDESVVSAFLSTKL